MALRGRPSVYLFFVQHFIIVLHFKYFISQVPGMSIAAGLVRLPRCDVVIVQLKCCTSNFSGFFHLLSI